MRGEGRTEVEGHMVGTGCGMGEAGRVVEGEGRWKEVRVRRSCGRE